METYAWCALLHTNTNRNNVYRIRFNMVTSHLLDGVDYVSVIKTERYLVLTPTDVNEVKNNNVVHILHKNERGYNIAYINMNRIVMHERIISGSFFGLGTRYKIKKDKDGRIYICLAEVIK